MIGLNMSKTVTKNDLIQVVIDNSTLTRQDAYKLVEDFFDVMTKSLEDDD
jgi:nucleoid DNA-binding protein